MKKKGLLVVVSGFSGVGKGTLINKLLEKYENQYCLSISDTTRNIRQGEKEGVNYFYISKEEFEDKIKNNELLEYANYVGNYYGTPKKYVEDNLNDGRNVILEIEAQGAMQIKSKFPQSMLIFILPPDVNTLLERLEKRGTEDDDTIRLRILQAKNEVSLIKNYDYILINDDLEKSTENMHILIENEKNRTFRCDNIIQNIQAELNNL